MPRVISRTFIKLIYVQTALFFPDSCNLFFL